MMNGTEYVRIPKFMVGEELSSGYYDSPNPYMDPTYIKIQSEGYGELCIEEWQECHGFDEGRGETVFDSMIPKIKKIEARCV